MRTTKSLRVGSAVAAFALAFSAGAALADVSTERPGSILIFPKVVSTADQETVIQISNTQPFSVHARCFYINAARSPWTGQRQWQVTDFYLWLTRLQPTTWVAGIGRAVDPSDNVDGLNFGGDRQGIGGPLNAGFDPGPVPPVIPGFEGALICAEVGADEVPIANNALTGEATIKDRNTADVSKYSGLAIQGLDPNPGDNNVLQLDETEYSGCPVDLHYQLIADEAADPVVQALGNGGRCVGGIFPGQPCNLSPLNPPPGDCPGDLITPPGVCTQDAATDSEVFNFISIIPCANDMESLAPSTVDLGWRVVSEFEAQLSGNTEVQCWDRFSLSDPRFNAGAQGAFNINSALGTTFLHAIFRPRSQVGALAVVDSVVVDSSGANTASASSNLHMAGGIQDVDGVITGGQPLNAGTSLPNMVFDPQTAPAAIRISDP